MPERPTTARSDLCCGEIVRLAKLETVTGLPNRSTRTDRIERALNGARRQRSTFAIPFGS
ncbi:hypothetical protein [Paraburkholderia ginsengisoli]|uniref:Uncharacterized protein n=1 Tax=Paraburkholderia ginsengisoli TaxID=311231 RepID=A0A7T4N5J9_9BURK|nr:hypothetical protein [Paraburkholderia ginsengisoli]QQC65593.1 hypothetical protein I6I06_15445 [Paraburkholderia ginsengisoli]